MEIRIVRPSWVNPPEPKTSQEKKWMREHTKEIMQAVETGKCKCGHELYDLNPLYDLGYDYGIECGWCR